MLDFDGLLEKIGPFGRYQIFFFVIIGMTTIPAGVQTLIGVYIFASPTHWCHVPELTNLSVEDQRRFTVPPGELTDYPSDTSCHILDLNYTEVYLNYINNASYLTPNVSTIKECTDWTYDMTEYGRTAVVRWDLVCAKASLGTLATSTYMLGFLIGVSLLGYVSDRIGRRNTWMVGTTTGSVLSCVASFMPEYWSFIVMRMMVAIVLSGAYTVGFVLVMEMIGKEKRVIPGIFFQFWFCLGYMTLPVFAYLIRDYIWLNFTVSILSTGFIGLYWIIPESARWLLTTGKIEAAKREIHRMGRINRVSETDTLLAFEAFLVEEAKKESRPEQIYSMIDMLRTPNMRSRTFTIIFTWLVTSMVFYGISLGVADLAGDPYINMVVSGAAECVGLVITVCTLNRVGRRWPLCVFLVFGGVACLAIKLLPPDLSMLGTVLAMLAKIGIAGSFAIVYVFTAELFPTVVRTIAVGSGSMGARIGGLIAPFVNQLGLLVWAPLPMLVFGGTAILAGFLSLFLPETLHQKLPETLLEGEQFGQRNKRRFFSLPQKNQDQV